MAYGEKSTFVRWVVFLMGVGFVIFSFWLYRYLGKMEAGGGSIRIHWLGALAYNIGGKLGLSAMMALVGLGLCWMGWTGYGSDEEE